VRVSGPSSVAAFGPRDSAEPVAILWDLDDTLFDHAGTCRRALRVVRAEFPALGRRSLSDLHAEYLALVDRLHRRVLRGAISSSEARSRRFAALLESVDAGSSPADASRAAELYRETYEREMRAVPGAAALLRHFAERATQGVVSNNPPEEQAQKLRTLGLDRYLRFVVTSQEVGAPKPSPKIFRAALVLARSSAGRAVMVGDSWAYDVLGARAAGIRAVWFNRRAFPIPEPTYATELRSFRPLRTAAPVVVPDGGAETVRGARLRR
jgi:putative hydrolase of the HAD superfamily